MYAEERSTRKASIRYADSPWEREFYTAFLAKQKSIKELVEQLPSLLYCSALHSLFIEVSVSFD